MGKVCSYNEWDPLEEVIVGNVVGAVEMAFEPALSSYFALDDPRRHFRGGSYRQEEVERAQDQLDNFAALLQAEGIVVRRPDAVDHAVPYKTPDFEVPCGHGNTCPRDVLLVVGEEIIEAPMAQWARFFEYRAYRSLIKEYFQAGAKWAAAPKPLMSNQLYRENYRTDVKLFDVTTHALLTEFEPCFDAACFMRFGKDIFWQPDLVSNQFGAAWLQRHLGPAYRIHRAEFVDDNPEHIDATLVPIRPGLVLGNPDQACKDKTLDLFKENGWEVIMAAPSVRATASSHNVSCWISMNILSLDEHTVVVEAAEQPMIDLMKAHGCRVLTCEFDQVYKFGGSFHCCTVDIRRRGTLQSYFPSLDTVAGYEAR